MNQAEQMREQCAALVDVAALLPEFFTTPAKKVEHQPAPNVGTVVQQLMRAGLKLD